MVTRYSKGGSIDIVMIENSAGIGVQYFPITEQAKAEAIANEMRDYHQRQFTVRIKNVPKARYPNLSGVK